MRRSKIISILHTRGKISKFGTKKCIGFLTKSAAKNLPPTKTFFFSKKSFNFYFLTYIQPPMAHLKITFWKKFDRVAQLLASKGSKKHLLGHISSSYRIFVITGAQWSGGGKCTFF
jgi:hypothetical protein